jgi:hypothetical protein
VGKIIIVMRIIGLFPKRIHKCAYVHGIVMKYLKKKIYVVIATKKDINKILKFMSQVIMVAVGVMNCIFALMNAAIFMKNIIHVKIVDIMIIL